MVVYAYNPSTGIAEAYTGLHSKFKVYLGYMVRLCQKIKTNKTASKTRNKIILQNFIVLHCMGVV